MKVLKNRFDAGTLELPDAGDAIPTPAKSDRYQSDRQLGLFALAGPVASKRSHFACLQPQPLFNGDKVTFDAAAYLEDIRLALQDQRIPHIGVDVRGNLIVVDGIEFMIKENLAVEGIAELLTKEQFDAALKKLLTLRNVGVILRHIDENKQIMGTPSVIQLPDGSLTIKVTAEVRVNPKLGSQANYVLQQHQGNLAMPESAQPGLRSANKRGTVLA
jgi:hypothetical protein